MHNFSFAAKIFLVTKKHLFSLTSRLKLCGIIILGIIALPVAEEKKNSTNLVAKSPRVPSIGIKIPEDIYRSLRKESDTLRQKINQLNVQHSKNSALLNLIPDIQVFHKAIDWGLRHQNFYKENEFKIAKKLLEEANTRATQLANGKSPWTRKSGLVVRGYISKIDNSIQPYGLVIPKSYTTDPWRKRRLDIWLHGRDNKLSELKFIHQRQTDFGQFTPIDTIVLHPYGRFCNAFKFAGEMDVIEALENVIKNYPVDKDLLSIRGFSMGGAGCWHLAVHHASNWIAAAPGAGFAESQEYLGLSNKELPPKYERTLWGLYDATLYAGNLFNTSTIAYSGEYDKQIQAAKIMEKFLAAEGLPLQHIIGTKTGHKYHRASKAEIDESINNIVTKGRKPIPSEVRLTTRTLRYNLQSWVQVDGIQEHWMPARVEAGLIGDKHIEISTINISRIILSMPSGTCPLKPNFNPTVIIDGQKLSGERVKADRSWKSRFIKTFGRWRAVRNFEFIGLAKRPKLQGPIDDAFMDSFLMVKPTGNAINKHIDSWIAAQLNQAILDWEMQFRGKPRVVKDIDLSAQEIKDNNLILWGDYKSNSIIAKIINRIPIKWNRDLIEIGQSEAPSKIHIPILIYPNPLNQKRYIVLNSGFTFSRFGHMSNATQTPKLPDWALAQILKPYNAGNPECISAAGFFNEQWQPKLTQ